MPITGHNINYILFKNIIFSDPFNIIGGPKSGRDPKLGHDPMVENHLSI